MGPLLLLGAGAEDTHGAAVPVLLSGSKLGLHFPAGQVPDRRIPQPPVPVSTTRVAPGLILCTLTVGQPASLCSSCHILTVPGHTESTMLWDCDSWSQKESSVHHPAELCGCTLTNCVMLCARGY